MLWYNDRGQLAVSEQFKCHEHAAHVARSGYLPQLMPLTPKQAQAMIECAYVTNGCQSISNQCVVRATRPRETLDNELPFNTKCPWVTAALEEALAGQSLQQKGWWFSSMFLLSTCCRVLEQNTKPWVPRPASCLSLRVHVLDRTLGNVLVKKVPL